MSAQNDSSQGHSQHPYEDVRVERIETMRAEGFDPYESGFKRTHTSEEIHQKYTHLELDEVTTDVVNVGGRVLSIRNKGLFMTLVDGAGSIQVSFHPTWTPEQVIALREHVRRGDYIGVQGIVRRTKRGEITVNGTSIHMLCSAMTALPETYSGFEDPDVRYRARHLDWIVNDDSVARMRLRSKIIAETRSFMWSNAFLEVETPILQPIYGGAAADPFTTHHNALHADMFLRIAPELYLKRMLVGGVSERLFEIGRVFRNEGLSTRHNPEFTMMEAYAAYWDLQDVMKLVENLFQTLATNLHGSMKFDYEGKELDFSTFTTLSMPEAVKKYTGVDFLPMDETEARAAAKKLKLPETEKASWGGCLQAAFEELVEKELFQPTFITHFPIEISPFARSMPQDARLVDRFELFVNGWELANAYNELNEPIEQRSRMMDQLRLGETREIDEAFLSAMDIGMPPAGGLGIGMDRLIMVLTGATTIRDVLAFPALRHSNK